MLTGPCFSPPTETVVIDDRGDVRRPIDAGRLFRQVVGVNDHVGLVGLATSSMIRGLFQFSSGQHDRLLRCWGSPSRAGEGRRL